MLFLLHLAYYYQFKLVLVNNNDKKNFTYSIHEKGDTRQNICQTWYNYKYSDST